MISGSGEICEGDSVELTVECTGAGPWTIVTMGGTEQIEIPTSPYQITLSPEETMDVTINSVTDNIGCFNVGEGTATVTVNHVPVAPETPSGNAMVNSDNEPSTVYSTTQTPEATGHIWSITPSGAGTMEMDELTCTVTWTPGFNGVAEIMVHGMNDCGDGPASESIEVTVESSFGIDDNILGIGVSVYPNPSEGICNIELNSSSRQEVTIKVMNALGFAVYSAENLTFAGAYKGAIDLTGQAEGLYFLIIENDRGTYYKKLIIK
jgi:hypothetical protein